jgi:aryl-alcohol dehydrogenase-like predicted oxidoreductase
MFVAHKLALGTAQFGLRYGINNRVGQPSIEQAHQVLSMAYEREIRVIDTASAYGTSEVVLGQILPLYPELRVISKYNEKEGKNLLEAMQSSLRNLGKSSIYGYLFHNADFVIQNPQAYTDIIQLKDMGMVEKVGVSVYTPQQMERILNLGICPEIVQFPYSIFDQRFDSILKKLKELHIELHARSIYLQGLLLKPLEEIGSHFDSIKPKLAQLHHLAESLQLSTAQLCLQFAFANNRIDHIVIGVDSKENLMYNLDNCSVNLGFAPDSFQIKSFICNDEHILHPFLWKI